LEPPAPLPFNRRAGWFEAPSAKLIEEYLRRCVSGGDLYASSSIEGIIGVCKVLQGDIRNGINFIKEAVLRRERDGYQFCADWYRLFLGEVYLQIIAGNEKPPFLTLLKNLPIILEAMITASSRISTLITRVRENPQFDPAGHHMGRAQMILGLLYKAKKKRALAFEHLTEAKRIFLQFGQTPVLARVEAALAQLER
jgi:hypothetical protein